MRTAVVALALLVLPAVSPQATEALCCACRTCSGAAFCIDGINTSVACANLCVSAGCTSTVFDSADNCEGGCDGAPTASTATPSNTRTTTATATATPTATASSTTTATTTPTATPDVGGQIIYYSNDLPVPDATVALGEGTGTVQAVTTTTDANGLFGFADVDDGAHVLEPHKDGDFNLAVTALDGTRVLEFVAGVGPGFDDDQRIAADVTGNGTISALDATRILEFAAGVLVRFEVADNCESDWAFRPIPLTVPDQTLIEPDAGPSPGCRRGAIQYGNGFMPPAPGQNFSAVLYGDVTGNWMPDPTPTPP